MQPICPWQRSHNELHRKQSSLLLNSAWVRLIGAIVMDQREDSFTIPGLGDARCFATVAVEATKTILPTRDTVWKCAWKITAEGKYELRRGTQTSYCHLARMYISHNTAMTPSWATLRHNLGLVWDLNLEPFAPQVRIIYRDCITGWIQCKIQIINYQHCTPATVVSGTLLIHFCHP